MVRILYRGIVSAKLQRERVSAGRSLGLLRLLALAWVQPATFE